MLHGTFIQCTPLYGHYEIFFQLLWWTSLKWTFRLRNIMLSGLEAKSGFILTSIIWQPSYPSTLLLARSSLSSFLVQLYLDFPLFAASTSFFHASLTPFLLAYSTLLHLLCTRTPFGPTKYEWLFFTVKL